MSVSDHILGQIHHYGVASMSVEEMVGGLERHTTVRRSSAPIWHAPQQAWLSLLEVPGGALRIVAGPIVRGVLYPQVDRRLGRLSRRSQLKVGRRAEGRRSKRQWPRYDCHGKALTLELCWAGRGDRERVRQPRAEGRNFLDERGAQPVAGHGPAHPWERNP